MKKLAMGICIGLLADISVAICSVPNGFTTGSGSRPSTIWFNPNINYAYALLGGTNKIITYNYDKNAGKLIRIFSLELDSGGVTPTFGGTIDAKGNYMYVTNRDSSTIAVFKINQTNGELTQIQRFTTDTFPYVFAISPDGKYAYVSAPFSSRLLMFKINADGTLAVLKTNTHPDGYINTGVWPFVPSFSPTNNYLYLANYEQNNIVRYHYESLTGDLIFDSGWSLGSSGNLLSQDLTKPYAILFDYNNKHAIVPADHVNKMYLYDFDNDSIIPNSKQLFVKTGINPNTFIQWYQDNQFSYMGNYEDSTITEYRYNSDGTMEVIGQISTVFRPIVVRQPSDPKPTHLFVVSRDEDCIADYTVNPQTGDLEPRFVNTDATVNNLKNGI